jgi:MFS family permease
MPATRGLAADGTSPAPVRPSVWAPLLHRIFLALWLAQLVSNVGTWMQNVAAVWLMGTLGGGALLIALVQTATSLPVFLVGVPAGALADIVDRRRLLLWTQALMLAASGVLAALAAAGAVTPSLLLLLTFVLGMGSALNMPAWQAIQPELVPADEFASAVALNSVNVNVGRALGPAIGGAVVALSGPTAVFVVNALSFVAVMVVLARWHRPQEAPATPPETLLGAMRAGFRYGRHSRALRAVLVRTALFVVPASAVLALLPVDARDTLHLGAGGFGGLLTAFGAGAVVAAVAMGRIRERLTVDATITASTVCVAIGCVTMAEVHTAPVVAAGLVLAGAGWVCALSTLNVAAQGAVPEWVRARGMGLYLLVFQGGVAGGSAVWGAVAGVSLAGALLLTAAALGAGLAVAGRWPLGEFERLDLSPSPTWPEPVVVLEPRPGSGPVLVTLAYQVGPDDVEAFLQAMTRVGRVRHRTGAFRWSLYRDTAEPDCFLETFVVDSWDEHLRQHRRVTATDQLQVTGVRPYIRSGPHITHYVSAY